jgi:1-acyl-sn-glycerol-3-phosphate acyltransferase
MNRQPYETPPQWWSPRLDARWVRALSSYRRRKALREHGLVGVRLEGTEHLQEAASRGYGLLITPNHPTHADPYALLEASERIGMSFHYMTAWQVFATTHWLGRRVLRRHGCFSINREGHDMRAFRQAVRILEGNDAGRPQPLVIFPEGEVFHLNDRVTPFRRGAATAALRAARRSGRPVACIPCGLKFQYVESPLPRMLEVMDRLELRLGLRPQPAMPPARRIRRLADAALCIKEIEYFGRNSAGSAEERSTRLIRALLARLEDRYRVAEAGFSAPRRSIPERVKELRRRCIVRGESAVDAGEREQAQRDLADLFFVMQLYSYPADYLAGKPSVERLAETVDKLEEDVLHVRSAGLRGPRRAIVSFGEPVLAEPDATSDDAEAITRALELRVQDLLDAVNGSAMMPHLETAGLPVELPVELPVVVPTPVAAATSALAVA